MPCRTNVRKFSLRCFCAVVRLFLLLKNSLLQIMIFLCVDESIFIYSLAKCKVGSPLFVSCGSLWDSVSLHE